MSYDSYAVQIDPLTLTSCLSGALCLCVCGQGLGEVSRTEIGKKIKEGMEEAAKTAKTSAESVSKSGEMLGKTGAFRAISQVWSHCSHCGAGTGCTLKHNLELF